MFDVHYVALEEEGMNYERVYRPKGSGDWVLVLFHETSYVFLENELIVAEPDSMVLYKPGAKQDFSALRDFKVSTIHFFASAGEMDSFLFPAMKVLTPESPKVIKQYFEQINREYYTRGPLFEDQIDSLLRSLFVYLSREAHAASEEIVNRATMYRLFCEARFMMLSNCEKEWASTNMPGMVSKSRSQFYKYYVDFFGVSPMADLNRARIEKAKILLTNDEKTVTEVAAEVGYASIHHFSRTFKEHTGMPPLQYVKKITGKR